MSISALGLAAAVFVLLMVILVVAVVLSRKRGRAARPLEGPPEHVPHPGAQPIPPTGSR